MKMLWRFCAAALTLCILATNAAPYVALAQITGSLAVVPVSEPQGGQAFEGTTAPVVALGLQNSGSSDVTITGIVVSKSGATPDALFGSFSIATASGTPLGSGGTLNASHSATIPVSFTLPAGAREIFVVSAAVGTDASALGSNFLFSATGVVAPASITGTLPVPGAQYTVASGTPPPTCAMQSNPSVIEPGGSITLAWQSQNATGGSITGVGPVGPSGTINLLPLASQPVTTFVGTFQGVGGTAHCQATVQVSTSNVPISTTGAGSAAPSGTVTGEGAPAATAPAPTTGATQGGTPRGLVPCGTGSFSTNSNDPNSSTGCQACYIPVLFQNIINFAIGLAIPIAAALFAYAGFLMFTAGENTERVSQAKKIFQSAVIGFIIAITGYLVIDTVLHVVFAKSTTVTASSWFSINCSSNRPINNSINELLSSLPNVTTAPPPTIPLNPVLVQNFNGTPDGAVVCQAGSTYSQAALNCVDSEGNITAPLATAPPINSGCPAGATLDPSGFNCEVCTIDGYNDDGSPIQGDCETVAPNPPLSNTDCSAETIQAAAASGGFNLSNAQAQTLSCIAVPESSCGQNTSIATTPSGQVTSAAGMFQIVFGSGNDQCHNLNLDVCTQAAQAAGFAVNGNLNCYASVHSGQKLGSPACRAAAANINCNASAAACLVQQSGGSFRDWTADSRSSVQAQCIQRFN